MPHSGETIVGLMFFFLRRRQSLPPLLNKMTTVDRENQVAGSESMRQLTYFFYCLLSINSWTRPYTIISNLSSGILYNLLGHLFQGGRLFASHRVARLT